MLVKFHRISNILVIFSKRFERKPSRNDENQKETHRKSVKTLRNFAYGALQIDKNAQNIHFRRFENRRLLGGEHF